MKLTALKVKNARPGTHEDGRGLRLVVSDSGASRWLLRIQSQGRRREFGLGSTSSVGLAEARQKAEEMRASIRAGLDPVAERRKMLTQMPTFKEVALMVIAENLLSWRSPKHGNQWRMTMERYVFPKLGDVQIDMVSSAMIRDVLMDIWLAIPETARRVRQRIGVVLDYAHSRDWREQEAPMRSVSKGLPKQPKDQRHYAAMPWQDVPAFINGMTDTLHATETVLAAIEFTILTAGRSGEVRLMTWGEVDLENAIWAIPGERMKAGKPHRVPLSDRAVTLLSQRDRGKPTDLIFKGRKPGRPLSDMSLTMPLRRAELGVTIHGFRSSFRDWCGDGNSTTREVAEACLAHAVQNKTEAAYARSDYFDKRRHVMDRWADFCAGEANVVALEREVAS